MAKQVLLYLFAGPHRSTVKEPLFKIAVLAQAGPKKGKPLMVVVNENCQSSDVKQAGVFTCDEALGVVKLLTKRGDVARVYNADESIILTPVGDPKEDAWQECRIQIPFTVPKTPTRQEQLRRKIIVEASRQLAHYEQYRGQFKDYTLVQLTKRIEGKGGLGFERGEVTIGISKTKLPRPLDWSVYSLRQACCYCLSRSDIKPL